MKKEELTKLGVPEEAADKVLEAIEAEGAENAKKLTETEAELKTARDSVADLTEKVKSFDGVDVAALKKSAEDWEAKYNADMTAAKVNAAIELALTKAGAKDVSLAKHLIDASIVKLDGEKLVGLDEQLAKAKTEKAFLFGEDDKSGLPSVNTGIDHNAPAGGGKTAAEIMSIMGIPSAPAGSTANK